jgi:hypothetical protein
MLGIYLQVKDVREHQWQMLLSACLNEARCTRTILAAGCILGVYLMVAHFGLPLTFSCLGLGLIHLVIIEWSRYTPSLRTGTV